MADDAAAPSGELSKPAAEVDEDGAEESEAEFLDETDEADEGQDDTGEDYEEAATGEPRISHLRLATIVGLVVVVALAGLTGWLGFRAYDSHQIATNRKDFLAVGRQGAVNLTTIDFEHVDEDVQRILDSATGTFYDDFEQRAKPFADVVKQLKSKSVGNVTEAGLESQVSDSTTDAKVLVAVSVNTSLAGQPAQQPRAWRMRISVQKVGDDSKVSNVEFVP